ncbi:hypothetical protein RY831_03930 [Noviherbaspirillum sp. CPCC 100848]|uniref:Uncharacterized protein n=1 Tax=Noviherbaspirillum album TaxID=3080276 RepID=A0ABU6J3R8_9BURK|nr:hypothetical protein [Noviherbaspirillum sp. CPCC 100848]MEC4718284.1 hypothetical protein [Noviherbaspirillum sp. CPCC 100848]
MIRFFRGHAKEYDVRSLLNICLSISESCFIRNYLCRRLRAGGLQLMLCIMPALSPAQESSNTASLIMAERWSDAARAMLREAAAIAPTTGGLPEIQARAGYLDDALDTITRMYPNSQSWGYLELVRGTPNLNPEIRAQLVVQATAAARADGANNLLMFRAGQLAQLTVFHAQEGRSANAASLYAEALQTATRSLQDQANGGYRPVTQELRNATPGTVSEAMFEQVRALLPRVRASQDRTFACVDLAVAAERQSKPALANAFIACGLVEAKGLASAGQRASAETELGTVAVRTGFRHPVLEKPAKIKALREARDGRCEEAYAIATRQGQNLYVDAPQDVLSALVDDALSRGDMKCALYIAQRPKEPVGFVDAATWQRMADKQLARGERQQALVSYRKAGHTLTDGHIEYQRSEYDVRRALQLADSMRNAGLTRESTQLVMQTYGMLAKIYPRNIDGRLAAAIALAPALWRVGEFAAARQLLADACNGLATYDESGAGKIRKARLLVAAGDAAAQIATLSGGKTPHVGPQR